MSPVPKGGRKRDAVTRALRRAAGTAVMCLFAVHCGQNATGPASPALSPSSPAPTPPSVPAGVRAWLDATVTAIDEPDLWRPDDDLEFLRNLVGQARVVALGENTYGTQEFVGMKARMVRFLVEEMGFDTFVIDVHWSAARRLDHYLRTGEGDPVRLLSGLNVGSRITNSLFFKMIEWMREHHKSGGRVGFHGVDMGYPGMALHDLREYIRQAAPDDLPIVAERLECLSRFANDPRGSFPEERYGDQTDIYRSDCGESLEEVRSLLVSKREEYESVLGESAFALALRSHRVAFQYHLRDAGEQTEYESWAENLGWIIERMAAGSRVVVWVHNEDISTQGVGSVFSRPFASDSGLIAIAFSHARGRFLGVELEGSSAAGFGELELGPPVEGAFEAYFESATAPRFVLDLRRADPDAADSGWLFESSPFRAIFNAFDPARAEDFWRQAALARKYDAVVHFDSTGPTVPLPWLPPAKF